MKQPVMAQVHNQFQAHSLSTSILDSSVKAHSGSFLCPSEGQVGPGLVTRHVCICSHTWLPGAVGASWRRLSRRPRPGGQAAKPSPLLGQAKLGWGLCLSPVLSLGPSECPWTASSSSPRSSTSRLPRHEPLGMVRSTKQNLVFPHQKPQTKETSPLWTDRWDVMNLRALVPGSQEHAEGQQSCQGGSQRHKGGLCAALRSQAGTVPQEPPRAGALSRPACPNPAF